LYAPAHAQNSDWPLSLASSSWIGTLVSGFYLMQKEESGWPCKQQTIKPVQNATVSRQNPAEVFYAAPTFHPGRKQVT
jgi:hypothetical protein